MSQIGKVYEKDMNITVIGIGRLGICNALCFENVGYHSAGRFTELTGQAVDVRFLEKVNGEWKIVYLSHVNFASYEEEKEDDGESETED